jgi:ribosomal protein L44E
MANQNPSSDAPITQTLDVHSVQSKNPKGNQQTEGKRKSKKKKGKGDKKAANNVGEGKNEKRKVKFPCNLCTNSHLTHQFPRLEEAQNLLAQQQPFVLTNPFAQGKNFFSSFLIHERLGEIREPHALILKIGAIKFLYDEGRR